MKKNYYKSDLWKSFWHFKLLNLSPGQKSVHVRVLIVCPSLFSSSIALLFRPFFSHPALFSLSSTERFRSFSVSTMAHRIISCVIINLLDLFFFISAATVIHSFGSGNTDVDSMVIILVYFPYFSIVTLLGLISNLGARIFKWQMFECCSFFK